MPREDLRELRQRFLGPVLLVSSHKHHAPPAAGPVQSFQGQTVFLGAGSQRKGGQGERAHFSQTSRNPTNQPSESHHRDFGSWGSEACHEAS